MILPASVLNLCTKANPKFLTFNEEIHILALYIDVGAPSIQLLIEKVSQGCFADSALQRRSCGVFYLPEEKAFKITEWGGVTFG